MPWDMYYPSRRPDGTTPRTEPQNTDKAAQESLARSGAGALKPAPAVPRAIQDIIDELNAVRARISVLWAAEYKANKWGSTRPTPPTRPPYDTESVARSKEMHELDEKESQLLREVNEILVAARMGPGGPQAPTQVQAQETAAPRQE